MRTIWKFALQTTDIQTLEVPAGGEVLYLDVQGNTPCLWIQVHSEASKIKRRFATYGTGHPMNEGGKYVGSYMLQQGALVFHVYEV